MKFKIGDRVSMIGGPHKGQHGTVVTDNNSDNPGVHLDRYNDENHDCNGATINGHGWYEMHQWLKLEHPKYKEGSLDEILYAPYKEGEEIE